MTQGIFMPAYIAGKRYFFCSITAGAASGRVGFSDGTMEAGVFGSLSKQPIPGMVLSDFSRFPASSYPNSISVGFSVGDARTLSGLNIYVNGVEYVITAWRKTGADFTMSGFNSGNTYLVEIM